MAQWYPLNAPLLCSFSKFSISCSSTVSDMLANLFRYDVIKRLSHGYCPIGPMGNAMRVVPSLGTFPIMDKPALPSVII